MVFESFFEEDLAQYSYAVACPDSGEALIVDALRDIDQYIDWAAKRGVQITAVAETHIHADFLSGARELAAACGASLYLSAETTSDWEYSGLADLDVIRLHDRDEFRVGNVGMRVLHTPGHTPEHLSFAVLDADGTERLILSGDFLFVDDLGRPDLLEEAAGEADTAREWASTLFDAVVDFVEATPQHATVWPGHGAGSACGKSQSSIPATSVGRESRATWWATLVGQDEREAFVSELLDGQPETPHYFARMKKLNRDGMQPFGGRFVPPRAYAPNLAEAGQRGVRIVDVRDAGVFALGHVDGAYNMPLEALSTYAGWVLRADEPVLLVAPREEVERATRKLARIGLDDVTGWVPAQALDLTSRLGRLSASQTQEMLAGGGVELLDVRSQSEVDEQRIPGSRAIHYGSLRQALGELDRDVTYVVHCATGRRATLAASIMAADEFDVSVFPGGPTEWEAAGFELV